MLTTLPATAQTWNEQAALAAPAPAADDGFGRSVSLHGDTAVVGAPLDDQAGVDAGAAYVFVRSGTTWGQQAVLLPSSPAAGDEFGQAVAVDGDTILVGAPLDDPAGALGSGAAYVFVRSGTTWSEQAYLTLPGARSVLFGSTGALQGNAAVVGTQKSAYYMFQRSGTSWANVQTESMLSNSNPIALAIEGQFLFAASPEPGGSTGEVEWYTRQGANWAFGGRLYSGDPTAGADFGASVAASGHTLVVGEPKDDLNITSSSTGSVYVYAYESGAWSLKTRLTSIDPKAGERFGKSVAVEGGLIAVGAHFDKGAGTTSHGAVHLFGGQGGTWQPLGQLTKQSPAAGDRLGVSVGLSGSRVLAGAVGDDPGGVSNAGGAYVFVSASEPAIYCSAGTSASGCRAAISAVGTASATASAGFLAVAGGVEGAKSGLFIYGTGARTANPWGNGSSLRCFAAPVQRGNLQVGKGVGGACEGWFLEDLNARWCPSCPRPQHNPGAGNTVRGQLWYRDPQSTSNRPTSFSDAFEALVAP